VNSFAIRSALVVIALLVGAWLALGVRADALENSSQAVINRARSGPIPPAQAKQALDDLARAGRLSPDQTPVIHQGELLAAIGRTDEANAVAKRATDAEPENLQAWFLTWVLADPGTPAKARAKARLLYLNPWFAYALRRR
jgi:tetratricopeptide (TPR) repeat protein